MSKLTFEEATMVIDKLEPKAGLDVKEPCYIGLGRLTEFAPLEELAKGRPTAFDTQDVSRYQCGPKLTCLEVIARKVLKSNKLENRDRLLALLEKGDNLAARYQAALERETAGEIGRERDPIIPATRKTIEECIATIHAAEARLKNFSKPGPGT
ncbi:MAG: hypothetical protein ACHQ5A_06410 [Opitutales bacterium]